MNGRRSGFLTVYHPQTKQSFDLTSEEATQPALAWDGRHIMYITLSGNAQQGDLWVSEVDGSNRVKITSGTEACNLVIYIGRIQGGLFSERERRHESLHC